jgi:hypothetical protein
MKRRVLILGSVLVAVAVLWSVFWFIAAAYAERAFLKVVDDGIEQGFALDCVNRRIEGYPFRIVLRCGDGTSLAMPDGTVTLSSLTAVALIYNPRHVIAEFGAPAVISDAPFAETRLEWTLAHASVVLDGSEVGRVALSIEEPRVASFGLPPVSAKLAELHLRSDPRTSDSVDVALRLDGVDAMAGQPPVDVQAIAVLHHAQALIAAAQGGPMMIAALGEGVPLELSRLSLAAGDAAVSAAGDITVRPDGALDGAVNVAVTTGEGRLPYLDGVLSPKEAETLRNVLQAVLNFGKQTEIDGKPARAFPLSISAGRVSAGLFPIGRIPPIPLAQLFGG